MRKVSKREREASARRVKAVRSLLGLDRSEFAARLKRSIFAVRAWEQGVRVPDVETMARIEGLRP